MGEDLLQRVDEPAVFLGQGGGGAHEAWAERRVGETAASQSAREGAAIVGVFGAIVGGIAAGPAGLVAIGTLGSLYGALGGALAGAGSPDRRLDRLARHLTEGKVLVVVEAPSLTCREGADIAMAAHGGEVQHKPFF